MFIRVSPKIELGIPSVDHTKVISFEAFLLGNSPA